MGLRQLHTAETMFIDDGLTDGAVFPPSSNAVYDALQSAIELPSVTTDDNGDVLTVVEGAWAKATPSGGGGGGLIINAVWNEAQEQTILDKTWGEICSAMASGQNAVIIMDNSNDRFVDYSVMPVSICYSTGAVGYEIQYTIYAYTYEFIASSENDYPIQLSN